MAPWVLESNTEPLGRTFTRPLGINELAFYYDSCFNSTAEAVSPIVIELKNDQADALLEYENVSNAWLTLKRFYPLLGTKVRGHFGTDSVRFAVSEKLLNQVEPEEIIYTSSRSDEDSSRILYDFTYRPQRAFHETPARLLVIRHLYKPHRWHVATGVTHFITDGTSTANYLRLFCDLLTFGGSPNVPDLMERLAMVIPAEDLSPTRQLRLPQQRWRYAIAGVIFSIRNHKIRGGHPLPRKVTSETYITPAIGRDATIVIPGLAQLVARCRKDGISFGSIVPVMSQVAISRVLWRRYLRGEISKEEWDHILKQPYHGRGPVGIRPFLHKKWRDEGGYLEVMLSITYFSVTLPCLPGPGHARLNPSDLDNGTVPLSSLLSRAGFIHRCRKVGKQLKHQVKHPLFLDIGEHSQRDFLRVKRETYLQWRAADGDPDSGARVSGFDLSDRPIFASEWTSLGDLNEGFPTKFPIPTKSPLSSRQLLRMSTSLQQDHKETLLEVVNVHSMLHARPTDFYLMAGGRSSNDALVLNVLWDRNVYADDLMKEWLDEVHKTLQWYLGMASVKL